MIVDPPVIWAGILALAVFLYVVLDGFDLGLGILFPAYRDPEERSVMVNTVASVWDWGFTAGSVLAAFSQGIEVDETARQFAGGAFDWLSPFSLLTGLSVVAGYALLGATWLVMKTEGPLRALARRLAWPLAITVVGAVGAVSLATPFLEAGYMDRWFAVPHIYYSAAVPILVGLTVPGLFHSRRIELHDDRPFLLTLMLYGLCFAGLGVSMWPSIVPPDITIHEAAAPPKAQGFMLLGAGILLPIILAYTAYAFWVFRGKVTEDSGYH